MHPASRLTQRGAPPSKFVKLRFKTMHEFEYVYVIVNVQAKFKWVYMQITHLSYEYELLQVPIYNETCTMHWRITYDHDYTYT